MDHDLEFVDEYLSNWDSFAQGQNELVPILRDNKTEFLAALVRMLKSHDKRAPARMVFYPIVQIGGSIDVDSDLGQACAKIVGDDFPITNTKKGEQVYFGGDLFFWWEGNRERFESFPLFDEWMPRDFTQNVVIPMYLSTSKRK